METFHGKQLCGSYILDENSIMGFMGINYTSLIKLYLKYLLQIESLQAKNSATNLED